MTLLWVLAFLLVAAGWIAVARMRGFVRSYGEVAGPPWERARVGHWQGRRLPAGTDTRTIPICRVDAETHAAMRAREVGR